MLVIRYHQQIHVGSGVLTEYMKSISNTAWMIFPKDKINPSVNILSLY